MIVEHRCGICNEECDCDGSRLTPDSDVDCAGCSNCVCRDCGKLLDGEYNNGETHDRCHACREADLTDAAYEQGREAGWQ